MKHLDIAASTQCYGIISTQHTVINLFSIRRFIRYVNREAPPMKSLSLRTLVFLSCLVFFGNRPVLANDTLLWTSQASGVTQDLWSVYFADSLHGWAVGNYVASSFLGYNDSGIEPRGIPASYESAWHNPFTPPTTQGASK